jgi:peptidylprolyl isomerase
VKRLLAFALAALLVFPAIGAKAADPANTLVIELSNGGRVEVELFPRRAPGHVERIKRLASEKFYDGVVFHRVIADFMAQTGDPQGTGMGGSPHPDLKAEFTDYPFRRGTVGAARTSNPDTANSQFFICFNNRGCAHLTGQYTVWGQVVSGMEHVDKITGPQDRMTKVYIKANPR